MANNNPYFIDKNSYPFQVNKRYVYYESLKDNSSNPYSIGSYKDATSYLTEGVTQLKITTKNSDSAQTKMDMALKYLQQVANNERIKEKKLIENFIRQFPGKIPKNIMNAQDDYKKLIFQLNIMIKNCAVFKEQLAQEARRANERVKLEQQKKQRIESRQKPIESSSFLGLEKTGKHSIIIDNIFNSKNNNFVSIITNLIIEKYGARLFTLGKQIQLNGKEMDVLIKILVDKANEIYIINKAQNLKKRKTDREQLEEIIMYNQELNDFLTQLEQNKNILQPTLLSIAEQIGMKGPIEAIQDIDQKILNIKEKLHDIYFKKHRFASEQEFETWRKEIAADDEKLKEMYAHAQNISIQGYYVNEQIAIIDMINASFSGTLGGSKNPTNDFLAGKLFFTVTEKKPSSAITQLVHTLDQQRNNAYAEINKTTNLQSFRNNTQILQKLRQDQQDAIQRASKNVNNIEQHVKNFLSYVNIHGTVKGYESVGTERRDLQGFSGAAFGENINEQLSIIQEAMGKSILSDSDIEWLRFAMLNAGTGAIGRNNKTSLEDYFSAMTGFFMFNDAQLMFQEGIQNIGYNDEGVNDIHLYVLNNLYVPSSFILQRTYDALLQVETDILSTTTRGGGINIKLHTYNDGPINLDDKLTISDWEKTSKEAMIKTKLEMHFLVGFLDILNNINDAMNPKHIT